MDTLRSLITPAPGSVPAHGPLNASSLSMNMVFASGAVDPIQWQPEDRRFTVFGPGPATITALRKAILDCAHQATVTEPTDTDARLHCFIAKLSGTMEGLGERELDAALWNLMTTHRQPTADEQLGIDWWNGLTEERRAHWLRVANSAAPFAAWLAFCRAEDDLLTDG